MASIVVHGGAYAIPDHLVAVKRSGVQIAATNAHKALMEGKTALDAVEIAIKHLEDDPAFNAGHGGALNAQGEVELDAIIVDGSSLEFGAVAAVENISNPISLARMVMEKSDHVMLVGKGANMFAQEMKIPSVDPKELIADSSKAELAKQSVYNRVIDDSFMNQREHDTVGAVAIDLHGNMAAGTSTGGITAKRVGRVGDSPLIGCGACCDNEIGGVSCTGHGEAIAKVTLASRVLNTLKTDGCSPEEACRKSLEYMKNKVSGYGGVIMISSDGYIAKAFSTKRMAWAGMDKTGVLQSGIDP